MLKEIFDAIESAGGEAYFVGGFVRDFLLKIPSKDIDIEVFRLSYQQLSEILAKFGKVDLVGKSFGVIKVTVGERDFDFSLPRRESKNGIGHKGFEIFVDENITLEEAAGRRDFTINSISMDKNGKIYDYYGGRFHLENRILAPTTEAFRDDVLRVARGFQFSARFNMNPNVGLYIDAYEMKKEYHTLPKERIWEEWKKFAAKGVYYSTALRYLKSVGWLSLYPELNAIYDIEQDFGWHPEGWDNFLNIIPIDSGITSSTSSDVIDNGLSLREFVSSSITNNTSDIFGRRTFKTSSINNINSFVDTFSADRTRSFSVDLSSMLSETVAAKSMSFMFSIGRTARTTDKRFRVMFKISHSSMRTIVDSSVNDLEVINRVVSSVSVYMMNVLTGFKLSSQVKFHDITMEPQTSSFTNDNLHVFADVVDFSCESVNSDIVFSVDFCFDDKFWHNVVNPYFVHENVTYDIIHSIPQLHLKFGTVYIHTGYVLEAMHEICVRENITGEDRLVLIFAALCHDLGKATHTTIEDSGRITSKGHEAASGPLARSFLESIGTPISVIEKVVKLVENHMAANQKLSAKAIRRLSVRLGKATIRELLFLIEADQSGRPPRPKGLSENGRHIRKQAEKLSILDGKPIALVKGADIVEAGYEPGPIVGKIQKRLFKLQVEGRFATKEQGLKMVKSFVKELE